MDMQSSIAPSSEGGPNPVVPKVGRAKHGVWVYLVFAAVLGAIVYMIYWLTIALTTTKGATG